MLLPFSYPYYGEVTSGLLLPSTLWESCLRSQDVCDYCSAMPPQWGGADLKPNMALNKGPSSWPTHSPTHDRGGRERRGPTTTLPTDGGKEQSSFYQDTARDCYLLRWSLTLQAGRRGSNINGVQNFSAKTYMKIVISSKYHNFLESGPIPGFELLSPCLLLGHPSGSPPTCPSLVYYFNTKAPVPTRQCFFVLMS